MSRTANRTEYQRAVTLLRWLRLEAMDDGDFITWRKSQSGFRIVRNGSFECNVGYDEIRALAQERLRQPGPGRSEVDVSTLPSSKCSGE